MLGVLLILGTFLTVFAVVVIGGWIMAKVDDLLAILARIDTATTNIAQDITDIKGQIGTGMSDADVQKVQDALTAAADKLDALDAQNPEGTPVP